MKSSYRCLLLRRNLSFCGFPHPKSHNFLRSNSSNFLINSDHTCKFRPCPLQNLGFRRVIDHTQKFSGLPSAGFGQSRVFSSGSLRHVSVISNVSSDVRSYSTSTETRVNEKNFERIYVQGGMNVKPLVVDRIDIDETVANNEESRLEVDRKNVNGENVKGVNEGEVLITKKEESEAEKEAWKLLQDSVVMYCGSPVGTMAANDPGDKTPLNYDQVFIRDFVPSALAFLLKGEGEIVRNFLLHTLQLQVIHVQFCFNVLYLL